MRDSYKQFKCPLCGVPLDFPIESAGCGGFPEWHEEGVAEINIRVSYEETDEETDEETEQPEKQQWA